MPDITRSTISASQVAALWGASPYVTRWMLYHWARGAFALDEPENVRMEMGRKFEAAILDMASERLRLDVTQNTENRYRRHDTIRLGCTVDAVTRDPASGLGVVEAKNVDAMVWRQSWSEDAAAKHVEIQLQAQMLVVGARWGAIAALVGGNAFKLYRRTPNRNLWRSMEARVREFWSQVNTEREPSPTGIEPELRVLDHLYPRAEPLKVRDLADDHDAAEVVEAYAVARRKRSDADADAQEQRILLAAMMGDAEFLYVPGFEVHRRDTVTAEKRCPKCNHKLADESVSVSYKTRRTSL